MKGFPRQLSSDEAVLYILSLNSDGVETNVLDEVKRHAPYSLRTILLQNLPFVFAIHKTKAEQYAQMLPDTMPPIVCAMIGDVWTILDGHHRIGALKALGQKQAWAYLSP